MTTPSRSLRQGARFVSKAQKEQRADAATTTGGEDSWDRRSHIERINPGDNAAHIPGQGLTHASAPADDANAR